VFARALEVGVDLLLRPAAAGPVVTVIPWIGNRTGKATRPGTCQNRRVKSDLPVDVKRLKAEFADLSDEDLSAYVTITRRVLGDPAARARAMREVMDSARKAQEKAAAGGKLTAEEQLLVRYLAAVAKMQRSTVRKPH